MSYVHFTTFERSRIEMLSKQGYSSRQIGKELQRHHSSIARELKRNKISDYQAEVAHDISQNRRKKCYPKGKKSEKIIKKIQDHLKLTWSPEQISETIMKGKISFKTIYRWIYEGTLLKGNLKNLRHKGKRQKPRETRGRFNVGTSISKRPKEVRDRTTFGHWELDTVVSSRGKSKGCLATFVERQSRFYVAIKLMNRSSKEMLRAISMLYKFFPKSTFKSFTVDRGKEFSCYKEIEEELGVSVYFADPYSSWQRGSNENANGLLREFFPKKTDLALVTEQEVADALDLINHRPRKCLEWNSSFDVFFEKLSHLT